MSRFIMIFFLIRIVFLSSDVAFSPNFSLEKYSFGSGSQTGQNSPGSTNFKLKASNMSEISYQIVTSPSYGIYPGYLHPDAGEILSPENVRITIIGDQVHIEWDDVPGATSYNIYSSEYPYTGFSLDLSGTFSGSSWSAPVQEVKLYYYVTAQ